MISDNYSSSQNQLKSARDRITQLLTQQSQPVSKLENSLDIGQSILSALSANTGAQGFNQAYQGIQQQREAKNQQALQRQQGLYDIMQDEVKQGNEHAVAIDKAIRNIAGNDINAYTKIANELHNSPQEINPANANLETTKIASRLGIKPMGLKSDEMDLIYKQAQINKLNAETQKTNADAQKLKNLTNNNLSNIDPILSRQIDKENIIKNRESASIANDSLRSLQAIENSLFDEKGNPKVETGKLQAIKGRVGQYIPGVDTANFQNVNAKATELSFNVASMLKGQTSDRDVSRSLESVPGYDKSPKANKEIINSKKAALKVISEMPKFTTQWRAKYGSTINTDEEGKTYDEAFLDWQAKKFKEYGGSKMGDSYTSSTGVKFTIKR